MYNLWLNTKYVFMIELLYFAEENQIKYRTIHCCTCNLDCDIKCGQKRVMN